MHDRVVDLLANPLVASLLLALGLLGLRAEAGARGFGRGAAAGLLSLSLLFGSHIAVGRTALWEVLLFALGALLLSIRNVRPVASGLVLALTGAGAALAGLWLSLVDPRPTAGDVVQAGLVLGAAALLSEGAARGLTGSRYISPRAIFRSTVWRMPPFR